MTPFELMFGESPKSIPLNFKNTKYPAMEERMKALLWNREEALASHKLARSHMADRWKSTFVPFKKGDKVWLDSRNLKMTYISQENETQTRRPLHYYRSLRTCDVQTAASIFLANSQCLPCNTPLTLSREWSLWNELHKATSWIHQRRQSLQGRINSKTLKTRMQLPILHQMERIPYFRCITGTGACWFNTPSLTSLSPCHIHVSLWSNL